MIEPWLKAIRDHPDRPTQAQRHVLTMLALRLSWETGSGFASVPDLCADADVKPRTVKYATSWARDAALLVCTRRGHRLGNGQVAASEWLLIIPQLQGASECTLRSQGARNKSQGARNASQGARRDPPSRPSTSRPSSSLADFAVAEVLRLTGKRIEREDAERGIKAKLGGHNVHAPQPWLAKVIASDPGWWLPASQPPRYAGGRFQ